MQEETIEEVLDPVETADTPEASEVASPIQADDGHEAQEPQEEGGSEAQALAQKREEGKLEQTQKELTAERAARQKAEDATKAYQQYVLSSPTRYKDALLASGKTEDEAATEIKNIQEKYPDLWKAPETKPVESKSTGPDPREIQRIVAELPEVKYARQQLQEAQFKEYAPFFDAHPEYDPRKLSDEEKRTVGSYIVDEVGKAAEAYHRKHPEVNLADAMEHAHKFLSGEVQQDISKAKEEGKLEGLMTKAANKASSLSAPTGSKGGSGVSLSAEDTEAASLAGMTPEEYLQWKS